MLQHVEANQVVSGRAARVMGALMVLALAAPAPHYTGSDSCAGCHEKAYRDWQGSHHWQAMQPADDTTVLGDGNVGPVTQRLNAEFRRRVAEDAPED